MLSIKKSKEICWKNYKGPKFYVKKFMHIRIISMSALHKCSGFVKLHWVTKVIVVKKYNKITNWIINK